MPSINQVEIMGHLGADPEIRFTGTGKSVATLKIATSSGKGDDKKTEWHNVIAWEYLTKQAESMAKGDLVYAKGKLQTRMWEKDGVKRYSTEIVANLICKCAWQSDQDKPAQSKQSQDDDSFPF